MAGTGGIDGGQGFAPYVLIVVEKDPPRPFFHRPVQRYLGGVFLKQEFTDCLRGGMGTVKVQLAQDRYENVEPGLAGRLDISWKRQVIEGLLQIEDDLAGLLEGGPVQLRLIARFLFAGVDVRVDIEDDVVRVVGVEIRRGFLAGLCLEIGAAGDAGEPRVKLDIGDLPQPQ